MKMPGSLFMSYSELQNGDKQSIEPSAGPCDCTGRGPRTCGCASRTVGPGKVLEPSTTEGSCVVSLLSFHCQCPLPSPVLLGGSSSSS